jgi:hypothetical protein
MPRSSGPEAGDIRAPGLCVGGRENRDFDPGEREKMTPIRAEFLDDVKEFLH